MAPYLNSDSALNELLDEVPNMILIDGVTSGRAFEPLDTELYWDAETGVLRAIDDEIEEELILVDANIWKEEVDDEDVMGLWKWDAKKKHYVRQMVGEDISFIFFAMSTTRTDEIFICTEVDTIVGRDSIDFEHEDEYFGPDEESGDIRQAVALYLKMERKLLR